MEVHHFWRETTSPRLKSSSKAFVCASELKSDGLPDSKKKFWGPSEKVFCYVKGCPKGVNWHLLHRQKKSLKGNTEKKVIILMFWRDKPPLIFEIKGSLPWNVVFFLTVLGTFWKSFFWPENANIPRSVVGPWLVHGPSMVGAWSVHTVFMTDHCRPWIDHGRTMDQPWTDHRPWNMGFLGQKTNVSRSVVTFQGRLVLWSVHESGDGRSRTLRCWSAH